MSISMFSAPGSGCSRPLTLGWEVNCRLSVVVFGSKMLMS